MNILYVGDVMGEMGIETVEQVIPALRNHKQIDLVIAQAENTTNGRGINLADFQRLRSAGIDFCTGGNWSLHHPEIIAAMNDVNQGIIRPANYPEGTPGKGFKYAQTSKGNVLIVSLLGKIVGKDADKPIDNPLKVIDQIIESQNDIAKIATIVNFHGDYSSEKFVIGHYLDGRVTAAIGDHWHIPTADCRVLPKGSAHITDVGMCGALDASLGVTFDSVIPRWRDGKQTRNILASEGRKQFNAVLIQSNERGLATSIEQIQTVL